jgi:acetyl esterase/lipase
MTEVEITAGAMSKSARLWEQVAPHAKGSGDEDIPTLTPMLRNTEQPTAAIIVCPGGGYGGLAPHEGEPVGRWLNSLGIGAFVLKYRLGPKYRHPVEMHDVQRAMRLVRARANEWNIDPKRIGVLGFSAGGHLASTATTHFDEGNSAASDPINRISCRPDLAILIYPVISMLTRGVHSGSRANLLGENPDPQEMRFLSSELQVTAATPPCFLVHGADDVTVPVSNSLRFASACAEHNVPVELHVFEQGPHGFGMAENHPVAGAWPKLAATWLAARGFGT